MFGQQRRELRQQYFDAWQQHQTGQPLSALQQQVLAVILEHPEYHYLFNNPEKYLEQEYAPELGATNPFLHMALHLSLREQTQTNRPAGIQAIYYALLTDFQQDHLALEHAMMDCLGEQLWQIQRYNQPFDEAGYLAALRQIKNTR